MVYLYIIWRVSERKLETQIQISCGHVAAARHSVLTGDMMLSHLHRQHLSSSPEILSVRDVFLSFVLITNGLEITIEDVDR